MSKMRLAKYLASAGIASRRKVEEYIGQGRIKVNGEVITVQGFQIDPQLDQIWYDEQLVKDENRIYILLNKPAGYLSSVRDDYGRPLVTDLLQDVSGRIYPVGRLDMNTEGLLLLTNDGDFAHRVIHPRHSMPRKYEALVRGLVTPQTARALASGIWLEDGFTGPVDVKVLAAQQKTTKVFLEIQSGKKRIVRRILKSAGHPVIRLKRVALAFLTLEGVASGTYRYLYPEEIQRLLSWPDN